MKSIRISEHRRRLSEWSRQSVVFLIVLVVAASASFFVSLRMQPKGTQGVQASVIQPEFSDSLNKIQITAADYLAAGDIERGLEHYDKQIVSHQDNEQKKVLLRLKSGFALMSERLEDALVFAKQADKMGSDFATNRALAEAYRANGDEEQARIHYEKSQNMTKNGTVENINKKGGSSAEDNNQEIKNEN